MEVLATPAILVGAYVTKVRLMEKGEAVMDDSEVCPTYSLDGRNGLFAMAIMAPSSILRDVCLKDIKADPQMREALTIFTVCLLLYKFPSGQRYLTSIESLEDAVEFVHPLNGFYMGSTKVNVYTQKIGTTMIYTFTSRQPYLQTNGFDAYECIARLTFAVDGKKTYPIGEDVISAKGRIYALWMRGSLHTDYVDRLIKSHRVHVRPEPYHVVSCPHGGPLCTVQPVQTPDLSKLLKR